MVRLPGAAPGAVSAWWLPEPSQSCSSQNMTPGDGSQSPGPGGSSHCLDSASNTTVVNIANKKLLSSPDASSSQQWKTHLAVELPPDEMSLYKSTRTILSKYFRAIQCSNYFQIQVYHETTWTLHHTEFGLSHHMHQ